MCVQTIEQTITNYFYLKETYAEVFDDETLGRSLREFTQRTLIRPLRVWELKLFMADFHTILIGI